MTAKVLIIEDDVVVVKSTTLVLDTIGCEVHAGIGGEEGLQKAKALRPDLILLDIMMPDMDGWQVLMRLKGDPDTRNIPVVIFTAYEISRGGEGVIQRGAVGLVQKPFEPEELLDIVRRNVAGAAQSSL